MNLIPILAPLTNRDNTKFDQILDALNIKPDQIPGFFLVVPSSNTVQKLDIDSESILLWALNKRKNLNEGQ